MFRIDVERSVACPIERAFFYLCDLRNDPEWWIGVKQVRCTSDTPWRAGATYQQVNALFGLHFPMDIEVTALEPCRRMEFRSTGSTLAPFVCTYVFTPCPDGTTIAMHGWSRADGRLFTLMGPLFRRLLRRFAEQNFERLRLRLERLATSDDPAPLDGDDAQGEHAG
jgi:uncharacterized protein YndB with AHSA1/START domain